MRVRQRSIYCAALPSPKSYFIKSCAGLFFCNYLYWGLSMLAHRLGVEAESLFRIQCIKVKLQMRGMAKLTAEHCRTYKMTLVMPKTFIFIVTLEHSDF